MRVPVIAALPENPTSACSLYRASGPLNVLAKSGKVVVQYTEKWNWHTVTAADIIFLQRPHTAGHMVVAEMARVLGRPLWIDFDDDVFAIPNDNRARAAYEPAAGRIAKIAALASAITVSTPALEERFKPLNRSVHLVPNAWNGDFFNAPTDKFSQAPHVMWRGSDTHRRDVLEQSPALIRAIKSNPAITWTFVGWNPHMITDYVGDNVQVVPEIDPLAYFQLLRTTIPALMVVPLWDCPFNQAKSNIAWQEVTCAAGGVAIAPDFAEWQRPGVWHYNEKHGIDKAVKMLLEEPERRLGLWRESREHIMLNLMLEHTNKIRMNVVESLYAMSQHPAWRIESRTNVVAVESSS